MTHSIVAGAPVTVAMLVLGTLVVLVMAVVGLVRGRGLRPALWAALATSVVVIGVITLGSAVTGEFGGQSGVSLVPFQEIQRGLNNRGTSSWTNVVGNVALFMPLGFAIACLARSGFWARWLLAALSGFVLSTAIEITQYSFGRVADIDDVILNTSGALAGGLVGALVAVTVIRSQREHAPSQVNS